MRSDPAIVKFFSNKQFVSPTLLHPPISLGPVRPIRPPMVLSFITVPLLNVSLYCGIAVR